MATIDTSALLDRHGRSFSEAVALVRAQHPRLPVPTIRERNPALLKDMAENYQWNRCAVCRGTTADPDVMRVERHHEPGGPYRSDVLTALIPLCRRYSGKGCHEHVAGRQRELMFARWSMDRESVDWFEWIVLIGSFPDEPLPFDTKGGLTLAELRGVK